MGVLPFSSLPFKGLACTPKDDRKVTALFLSSLVLTSHHLSLSLSLQSALEYREDKFSHILGLM